MNPAPGVLLSHYRLDGPIGAGGMGEVWRATDTTLDRSVAIKILPAVFAEDPHRLARFEREAKLLASLNHPNIAVIHGMHHADGIHFLVMELVEGGNLAQRIERGALPVDEAVAIARQVAEALEAAHDSGVIHRDLKPANIQIAPDGKVKVLDFGLAKAFDPETGSAPSALSHSPTMTAASTLAGTILGTAAYMSPEQARGKPVDRRADVWAFGCVLFEMLAGRRVFDGETVSDTLAGILKTEPDWSALPATAPAGIRGLMRRCLIKDPRQRLQAMGDARIAIDEALAAPSPGDAATPAARPAAGARARERAVWFAATALALLCLVLARGWLAPTVTAPRVVRAALLPPGKEQFDFGQENSGTLSISPDGRYVTFTLQPPGGEQSLWVRPVDSLDARPLPGTKFGLWPFWSPDSQQIAFFSDGKMKRIDLVGSPPTTICNARDGRPGDWNREGVILFAPDANSPIFSVPAAGGTPAPVTKFDETVGETTHRWARFLPDGRHFLYMAGIHTASLANEANAIYLAELGKAGRRRLMLARSNVAYADRHLLFVRDRALLAQPFDPERLELAGDPEPLAAEVQYDAEFFRANFAVSSHGDLVYRTGSAVAGSRLVWFGRDGKEIGRASDVAQSEAVALSPDGKRVAFSLPDPDLGTADIWIQDLTRGTRTRLTFGPTTESFPVWSPDGRRLVYTVTSRDDNLFIRPADGGPEENLISTEFDKLPTDWSRDGRIIVYDQKGTTIKSRSGVYVLPLADPKQAHAFVDTEFNERAGRLSPDGRWMLYTSDDSGRDEIYVAPFPGPGGKWQVSVGGAFTAWWSRGGSEILYISPDLTLNAVAVRGAGASFAAETPRLLFRIPRTTSGDVTADGQRFLMTVRATDDDDLPVTLVTNWPAVLKR